MHFSVRRWPLGRFASQQKRRERRNPFPRNVVRADLDFIWQTLLDVGVQPFRTSDRAVAERRYRAVRGNIIRDMNAREAWLYYAYVLAALNDGHVGVGLPDALDAVWKQFPIRFALDSDGTTPLIASDRTDTLPVGSRLVSIGGLSGARYSAAVRRSFGGQTKALERSRFAYSGKVASVALLGDHPSYKVRYDTGSSVRESTVFVPRTLGNALRTDAEPYSYRRIDDDVAYIDYRRCVDLERFQHFLARTFADIATRPTSALIIDIRENGGGDSSLNDALWAYITQRPFRQFGAVVYKSCDLIKRVYGRKAYEETYGDEAWTASDGRVFRDENPLIEPKPCPDRFTKPVYLMISARTFSSAMSCALAAKDYGLAIVVGEETGEPANTTGEVYDALCSGTGLHAYLTTKVFLAPKPHPDRQGVAPDIAVDTTLADEASSRDPVLMRTLSLARSNGVGR